MTEPEIPVQNKKVAFYDLGHIAYADALEKQKERFQSIVDQKLANRSEGKHTPTENHLLFCEHPHVYTLGRSGNKNNLLINSDMLKQVGATYFETGRGGDITYHGPGQLVGYPILDLDNFFTDIHKYLRFLEEAIILTLADYGLDAGRIDGLTGVWLDYDETKRPRFPRKICAFGVKASRWVTMHGFALNVNANLDYFSYIVPCGIADKAVTSLEKELGRQVPVAEVGEKVKQHLGELFGMSFV